jgi:hypothetical protein
MSKQSIYSNYVRYFADTNRPDNGFEMLTFAEYDSGKFGSWEALAKALANNGY